MMATKTERECLTPMQYGVSAISAGLYLQPSYGTVESEPQFETSVPDKGCQ
jgi:hypothetical protein